jgi:glycosyltransferase involved in cell wall biosynthesis
MKNILFLTNKLLIGGAEMVMLSQANSLDAEKYKVFFGLLYNTNQENTLYHKLKTKRIFHFGFSRLFDIKGFFKFYRFLKKNKIEIIVSALFEANLVARILGRLVGVKIIISSEQSCYYNKSWWQKKVDLLLSYVTDVIIGVSEEVVKFTSQQENIPFKKFRVLDQISDLDINNLFSKEYLLKKFNLKESCFVCMNIGRFSPEKDQNRIIEIANEIVNKKNIKDMYFFIVGYGDLEKNLIDSIKKYKLEKNVKIVVDPKNAKEYLVLADLFLLTSDREGMPIVILEAMNSNLPCISSNVGGVKDIVKDGVNGYLVDNREVEDFVDRIIYLFNNKKIVSKMKLEAKKIVDNKKGRIDQLELIIDEQINKKYL